MIIYVPVDENVKYALVIVQKPHTHPTPALHKTSHAGEVAIKQVISAADPAGLNVSRLLTGKLNFVNLYVSIYSQNYLNSCIYFSCSWREAAP
jgi:hypothetical protein